MQQGETSGNLNLTTILIAEDNFVNMTLAKILIKKILPNARLIEAENGKIAMEQFIKEKPKLILMDVNMPEINGYTAASEIRNFENNWKSVNNLSQKEQPVYIIALTAGIVKGEKERCLAAGMNDYISKPIESNKLLQAINQWHLNYHQVDSVPATETIDEEQAHFNMAAFKAMLGNSHDQFDRIISAVKETLAKDFASLEKSVNTKEWIEVKKQAHKIKGTALTVYFTRLAEQADAIENMETTDPKNLNEMLHNMGVEIEIILGMLTHIG